MAYKKPEPNMMEIAKRWLSSMIWRAAPKRTLVCHLCNTLIHGGTEVYRYIKGFRGENPQTVFVCDECGQELVRFMIERLQELLPEKPVTIRMPRETLEGTCNAIMRLREIGEATETATGYALAELDEEASVLHEILSDLLTFLLVDAGLVEPLVTGEGS